MKHGLAGKGVMGRNGRERSTDRVVANDNTTAEAVKGGADETNRLNRERRTSSEADRKAPELLRREEVEHRFGVSRSWIYCEMRAGRFPEPVRIGKRAVRWKVVDLDEWAAGRPVAYGEIGYRRTGLRKSGV